MNISPKDKISTVQTAISVTLLTIGVSILTVPRAVTEAVGTPDGWLSILIGGLISISGGYLVVKLSQIFPGRTFFQYNQMIVGKTAGLLLSFLFIIHFILLSGYEARALSELVRIYLLERTPREVIVILFLATGTYLVVGGINPIVRLLEVYFPIIMLLILIGMISGFQKFELDNLRPVLAQGMGPVFRGVRAILISYVGYESMLVLINFMQDPKKAFRAVFSGVSIAMGSYLLIFVMVVGMLTVEEVQLLTWPVASASMEIEVPGGIIERFEPIFLVLWILTIYTTFVLSYYLAGFGLAQVLRKEIHPVLYGLLPIMYIAAMLPPDLNTVFQLGDLIGYTGITLGILIPLLLLGIVRIRGIGNEPK